ncbi:MAG: lipid-A-disaccharide synthase-related protein [Cyanobacteria bacterium P01_A01_bin.123]
MRLLCISHGYAEDRAALKVLEALRHLPQAPELFALPLVGSGQGYLNAGIPVIGPAQDLEPARRTYAKGDDRGQALGQGFRSLPGLLAQFQAVRQWAKTGQGILAVGGWFPLMLAWASGLPYSVVDTTKSDYCFRDEAGNLSKRPGGARLATWAKSVYLPWERWLLSRPRCRGVFVRDALTEAGLKRWPIPVMHLGNPVMDGLQPTSKGSLVPMAALPEEKQLLTGVLLPGERSPEVQQNWNRILDAIQGLMRGKTERVRLLAAIASDLNLTPFREALLKRGWHLHPSNLPIPDSTGMVMATVHQVATYPTYTYGKATLALVQNAFPDCLHQADFAISMASTATEQFVGLGKPAITLVGDGPLFTLPFAQAQARLLGPSVILVKQPEEVGPAMRSLLQDPDHLQMISDNGKRRLGPPGATYRIAQALMEKMGWAEALT